MSRRAPDSGLSQPRQSWLLWILGLGFCFVGIGFAYLPGQAQSDARESFYKFGWEDRVCEPRVRRINMALVVSGTAEFSELQRRAARDEIAGLLVPVLSRVQLVDRGVEPRLGCSSLLVPKSSEDLTVLLLERRGFLSLATIHYRPDSDICRSGEVDLGRLQIIPLQQRGPHGAEQMRHDTLRIWAQNLPRIVNPDCRGGYVLAGANNIDPRNLTTVRITRSYPILGE